MYWSQRTYRLDEVTKYHPPPVVIHANDGYYSETDAESISAGDIIKIDKEVTLEKVAANFAKDVRHAEGTRGHYDYVNLSLPKQEILLPLKYNAKLKVKTVIKHFESVMDLSKEFPRYAKLKENLKITTKEGAKLDIQAGTIIELDRIIPGDKNKPDKLVVQFQDGDTSVIGFVFLNERGKFMTEPDDHEYTLQETIDRYKLPQVVRFVDDEIKRIYSADMEEGVVNMKSITETLRLNRLVFQNVLFGHYKPLEGADDKDTENARQRTLVVLPLDLPDIREIEVNVLMGATEDDYSTLFFVRNIGNDLDIVDGSLYVDFAFNPGVKRLANKKTPKSLGIGQQSDQDVEEEQQPRPPATQKIPPITHKLPVSPNQPPQLPPRPAKMRPISPPVPVDTDDSYEMPVVSPPPIHSRPPRKGKQPPPVHDDGTYITMEPSPIKLSDKTGTANDLPAIPKRHHPKTQSEPGPTSILTSDKDVDADENPYDYVDEDKLTQLRRPKPSKKPPLVKKDPRPVATVPPRNPQIARVPPITTAVPEKRTTFFDLNGVELEVRLLDCGMKKLAKVCKHNQFDGAFFENISDDALHKSPFNLNNVDILKFKRVKEGWIPT